MMNANDAKKYFEMIRSGEMPELTWNEWRELMDLVPQFISRWMDEEDYLDMYEMFGATAEEYEAVAAKIAKAAEEAEAKELGY